MRIGLIGVGVVGGVLRDWFVQFTKHELKLYDPAKGMTDSLEGCKAIFVSVPVPSDLKGQNQNSLEDAVMRARQFTDKIFIRSTVLPGTNDRLRTISMPEFLTERKAYMDMCSLPILLGKVEPAFAKELFPNKQIFFMGNTEAELAKLTHNCFGAMKVTYFNAIAEICERYSVDFAKVKAGASLTGYIEPMHTQVPGPDGLYGYGGKCFPENVRAMAGWLHSLEGFMQEHDFFDAIESLNYKYRGKVV